MENTVNHARRRLLGTLAAAGAGAGAPLALNLSAMAEAAAQTAGADDYKALVCVFLQGGNDHYNTVLATDTASWSEYTRLRASADAGSIALPAAGQPGGVLPIVPATGDGRSYALHPNLGELKALFDNGSAAIVANVGPLVQPTTLAQYRAGTVSLPPKLFSHNDQQSIWQSNSPEGAAYGWGGRLADCFTASNGKAAFTSVSTSGNALFLSGRSVFQYQITKEGPLAIPGSKGSILGMWENANPLLKIMQADSANPLEADHAAVARRAIQAQAALASALAPAGAGGAANPGPYRNPFTNALAENPLATQLQLVARMIASRARLGLRRQVFFVSLAGFDTHGNQKNLHADAMAKLAHGIGYFDNALSQLMGADVRKQVTLFTASDFGRTLVSNGDGSDHGWGAHHFVVGGAVRGSRIYGSFPIVGVDHELDVGAGALLPSTSLDQYAATLAGWFGLSARQIADVFPNLANFSDRNLGFMG